MRGRIAVVTGASRGIGQAVARALVREGARVMAVSRSIEKEHVDEGGGAGVLAAYRADVSDSRQVREVFQAIRSEHGLVTILVAAAGAARFGDTLEADSGDWERQIGVNLTGAYLCNVEAIRQMLEAGGGDIVNVLSVSATVALPGAAAYTASKAGALGMTRSLNAEFRARGVRISALLPGATDTELWDTAGADIERGRMMKPEDVAQAVVWTLRQPESAAVDELHLMPREGLL